MSDLHEEISRLLAGDLPSDRAEALRRRLLEDPEARRARDALLALDTHLASLPDEVPPPRDLDARVLGTPAPWQAPRRAVRRIPAWTVGAVAFAALTLAWALGGSAPEPEILLVEGTEWVSGAAVVRAGDHQVEIDGLVRIDVEPAVPAVREPGLPTMEADMRSDLVLAALAGAVVTVTVYEGTAWLAPVDADQGGVGVLLREGQRHTVGPSGAANGPGGPAGPAPRVGDAGDPVARLEAEIAELREQLAQARLEAAVARGQLHADHGEALPFPEDVPPTFGVEAFEDELTRHFASLEEVEIEQVDCGEYPCLAVIRSDANDAGWFHRIEGIIEGMTREAYGSNGSLAVSRYLHEPEGSDPVRYVIFGAWGDQGDPDAVHAVRRRASYRLEQIHGELDAQLRDGGR